MKPQDFTLIKHRRSLNLLNNNESSFGDFGHLGVLCVEFSFEFEVK